MLSMRETISVENQLASISSVFEAVEGFCNRAGISEDARRSVLLIVEEIFVNTVSYGYPEGGRDEVSLVLSLKDGVVVLEFTDHAAAFDYGVQPDEPEAAESLDDMAVGGLGLFLVHQFAQEVLTRREGETNYTTIKMSAV